VSESILDFGEVKYVAAMMFEIVFDNNVGHAEKCEIQTLDMLQNGV
jgi:hypothetical protein